MDAQETSERFEERLLIELRRVVEANPEPPAQRRPTASFASSWRRPAAYAGGLTALTLASVGILGAGDDQGSTAWAVTPNGDGTVTVRIEALSDAAGLERQLREAGIPAIVQYLPVGKKCADPPAGSPLPGEFGWTKAADAESGGVAVSAPWGWMETGFGDDDGIAFTVYEDVPAGESLAITTQTVTGDSGGASIEDSTVRIEYAEGDQSPCVVVDA